jgi:Transposase DDE domain
MRPSWHNARSESVRPGADLVAARPPRRCQGRVKATSTTSPTQSRASCANPTDAAFEQDYNAQVAVDQGSLLIVGWALSNHPNDSQEAEPTLAAIPSVIGMPEAAALDAGYAGPATMTACEKRGIEPYIATGRDPHHPSWQQRFAPLSDPPPEEASSQVKMAYKLRTILGKAIYGARKCTVEPVIGIIKEVLGFRQFSLRGELAAAGEWCLICLAFNLKRFHTLFWA